MAVKITYGSPNRWRVWTHKERPEPDSWFYEGRYHHTGTWKFGLDYRPLDGKFPDFWIHPFIWRPATAIIEAIEHVTGPHGVYGLLDCNVEQAIKTEILLDEYGEKAKHAKKLLFGSMYGKGAQHHMVDNYTVADEEIEPFGNGNVVVKSIEPAWNKCKDEGCTFFGKPHKHKDLEDFQHTDIVG